MGKKNLLKGFGQSIPEVKEIQINGDDILIIPKGGKDIINIIFDVTLKNNWSLANIEKAPVLMDEIFGDLTQN